MDYIDVLVETGIECFWLPIDFAEQGIYLAPCPKFINGAIGLRLGMDDISTDIVALHEIGHIVDGSALNRVNSILKHLKNEAKANQFMIREKALEWLLEIDFIVDYYTPERFLKHFGLSTIKFYDMAEQEMRKIALEYKEQLIY